MVFNNRKRSRQESSPAPATTTLGPPIKRSRQVSTPAPSSTPTSTSTYTATFTSTSHSTTTSTSNATTTSIPTTTLTSTTIPTTTSTATSSPPNKRPRQESTPPPNTSASQCVVLTPPTTHHAFDHSPAKRLKLEIFEDVRNLLGPNTCTNLSCIPRPRILSKENTSERVFGTTSLTDYTYLMQIGEGTYGKVYRANDKKSGKEVALKKVKLKQWNNGISMRTLREFVLLQQLKHNNIVELLDVFMTKESTGAVEDNIYLVMEYAEQDLRRLLQYRHIVFTAPQMAYLMKQLFEALSFSHSKKIIHRDVKSANILVNSDPEVEKRYTNRVISLRYRPPELLLGETNYGPAVDIWSCGCILGEMFLRRALFPAVNELETFELICNLCGTPDPTVWPAVELLPDYETITPKTKCPRNLRSKFPNISKPALDLLDSMLTLDPSARCTLQEALTSLWLTDHLKVDPRPWPRNM